MDPEATKLILIGGGVGAAKPALELIKDFTLRIFGPAADEIGKAVASPFARLNERRAERAANILVKAAGVVAQYGEEPHPVPDHLLLPLLTHASLVDDEDLQAVWAQLLASAAVDSEAVLPAFPQILSELSGREVAMLNEAVRGREFEFYERRGTRVFFKDDMRSFADPPPDDVHYIGKDNLIRLGIIEVARPKVELEAEELARMLVKMQRGQHVRSIKLGEERWGKEYSLTSLGVAFVIACAGPGAIKFKPEPPEFRNPPRKPTPLQSNM